MTPCRRARTYLYWTFWSLFYHDTNTGVEVGRSIRPLKNHLMAIQVRMLLDRIRVLPFVHDNVAPSERNMVVERIISPKLDITT